jgi:hypothetical protein
MLPDKDHGRQKQRAYRGCKEILNDRGEMAGSRASFSPPHHV